MDEAGFRNRLHTLAKAYGRAGPVGVHDVMQRLKVSQVCGGLAQFTPARRRTGPAYQLIPTEAKEDLLVLSVLNGSPFAMALRLRTAVRLVDG
jgi:hypothetical protein